MSTGRIPIPERIIEDIERERDYSSPRWDEEFDNKNTINDWAAYVNNYLARATAMKTAQEPHEAWRDRQRKSLVKAASLCISALEAFDRRGGGNAPRHYD